MKIIIAYHLRFKSYLMLLMPTSMPYKIHSLTPLYNISANMPIVMLSSSAEHKEHHVFLETIVGLLQSTKLMLIRVISEKVQGIVYRLASYLRLLILVLPHEICFLLSYNLDQQSFSWCVL